MDNSHTLVHGNRLPVPAALESLHFLYKAAPVTLARGAVEQVIAEVKRLISDQGLYPGQVELVTRQDMNEPARQALDALMGELPPALHSGEPVLLVCEQAFAHTDPSYAGSAFASVVLATGPEPYYLECFHTAVDAHFDLPDVRTCSRILRAGDVVVFDPTTPHMALPLRSHQDQLLVLLQVELDDTSVEARERLLAQLPPAEGDRNESDLTFVA